jgi:5-methylcytosine-specific restriction endonuclease McrA
MTITKSQLESRTCLHCGKDYNPTRDWQKTCSYFCGYTRQNLKKKRGITNNGLCARCGLSLENKRAQAMYCSKSCKSMDHNFKHRSRTRVQGIARRREIYERDNRACYICQKPLQLPDVHLDHLIPVARNGNSDPSNLAVSCGFCNRSRGTTIGIKQLAKLRELRT